MILLSVIGTGSYTKVKYQFDGREAEETNYVVKAIKDIFNPEKIFVLMTEESEEKHKKELEQVCDFESIRIQVGKNEEELWDMFSAVVEKVPEEQEVIIDITHGFRSQPMILLSIAVYLRVTKNVKIKHILYGAFDAKQNEVVPIFDLKPFLDLIDWSFAIDGFLKRGDASLLSKIVIDLHNSAYKDPKRSENKSYLPKGLKSVGSKLNTLSNALSVSRSKEVSDIAKKLTKEIDKAYKDVDNLKQVRPFKSLLDRIKDIANKFSVSSNDYFSSEESMRAQAEIIEFYLETKQYQRAITLARELLVSKVCFMFKFDLLTEREKAEEILNSKDSSQQNQIEEDIIKTWRNLVNVRNDINHAGMRTNPNPSDSIIEQVEKHCKKVIDIIKTTTSN
ncbi:MAG: TIGR02221 family CRISPR-associated protein [Bernardetiaceae bacterium]|nr:TIGR02221 family CRISPR-associated protein [Bernardetiaceae bacterium]